MDSWGEEDEEEEEGGGGLVGGAEGVTQDLVSGNAIKMSGGAPQCREDETF